MIPLAALIVVLLIFVNGFFAMSELAVVSARRARLQSLAEDGDGGAKKALALAEDPTNFLSSVQVGITLVGVFAGAYGTATLAEPLAAYLRTVPALAGYAYTIAFGGVVGLVTYLSLIIGELVPKRLALNNAERIAAFVARPMALLARIGTPVVWFLRVSTNGVLKLLRVPPTPASTVTEEEVKTMIAEGTESGVFHPAEKEMIEGVLRLADRPVRSIMTPRTDVMWLDPDDPIEGTRKEIAQEGHSRYPVSRGELDELLGVVNAKDLLLRLMNNEPIDLAAAAKQPIAVPESTSVLRLMDLFRTTPVHMAIVLDEYGGVEGIVTPTDVLTAIAGDLPEEHDEEGPDAVRREDGSWLIEGRAEVPAVQRLLGRDDMEGEDYSTLAGFVLRRLGRMPETTDSFVWEGLRFEVIDMDGRRIDKVLVRPEAEAAVAEEEA